MTGVNSEVLPRLRLAAVLILALALQTTVVPDLRILGVCADLMLLTTVCAALSAGPELGGLVGFAAGLLADLLVATTPVGLSALSFSLVGYAVGSLRWTVLEEGWLLAPATAFAASAAGEVIFVVAGLMVGQTQLTRPGPVGIVKIALLVGAMNAIVATPVARVVEWATSGRRQGGPPSNEVSSTAARRSSRLARAAR